MKKVVVPIIILAALAAWGIYGHFGEKAATGSKPEQSGGNVGIQKGDVAPQISLKNLHGKTVKLSDLHGKTVLINFWATWCPHCKEEMSAIQRFYVKHRNNGFTVLSVNDTSAERNQRKVTEFVQQHQLSFPVVLDVNSDVSGIYHVNGLPTSYFVDPEGHIFAENIGPLSYNAIEKVVKQMNQGQ